MLTETIKPQVHNILFSAGFQPSTFQRIVFKRTVEQPGEWDQTLNYFVTLQENEWSYSKNVFRKEDVYAFGDYSPEGLDKLRKVVTIDPIETE